MPKKLSGHKRATEALDNLFQRRDDAENREEIRSAANKLSSKLKVDLQDIYDNPGKLPSGKNKNRKISCDNCGKTMRSDHLNSL